MQPLFEYSDESPKNNPLDSNERLPHPSRQIFTVEEVAMKEWLEDPFKAVIGGTILMVVVPVALSLGIAGVGLFV